MAWQIRPLADASARIRGAFRQYMPGTDSALANNFVTVLGKVLAGLSHEFELRMAYLARQMFISTANRAFLALHASDVGIFRKSASPSSGIIQGKGAPNTSYPAGIRFVSGNLTYISTQTAYAGPQGDIQFAVTSEIKGAFSNRDMDGVLQLSDPVLWPDLSQEFLVGPSGLGGGADVEADEDLRARALYRKRNPPGGGRLTDYENLALSVPGVKKAWAFRRPLAPGFIVVYFLFDNRPNFIPTAADVTAVQARIDEERLIRVDDSVAVAVTPRPIDLNIRNLQSDTEDVRLAIEASVTKMLLDRGRPGVQGDTFSVSRSWIAEAISTATGEDRHILAAPVDDVILTDGQWPVLGGVIYGP